jgi:hypothetical protein
MGRKKIAAVGGFLLIFAVATFAQQSHFAINTKFSTDNGESWQKDFPVLESPGEVLVKVECFVEGKAEITSTLYSEQTDFSSANAGLQHWNNRRAWYQRLKKHWFAFNKKQSWVYRLDLGKRPGETMGFKNKWDKTQRKFVNGFLPPCPALSPGTYKFTINIKYHLKKSEGKVSKNTDFFVIIKNGKKEIQEGKNTKKTNKMSKTSHPAQRKFPSLQGK